MRRFLHDLYERRGLCGIKQLLHCTLVVSDVASINFTCELVPQNAEAENFIAHDYVEQVNSFFAIFLHASNQ